MTELLIIMVGLWMIVITWSVWYLYGRPYSGIDPDDIDMIKSFMAHIRKLAAFEKRKGGK